MTKLPEVEFKAGQMVYLIGYGFETLVKSDNSDYPLLIPDSCLFNNKGYFQEGDPDRALLTLEEAAKLGLFPPKKKVKKIIEGWVNVYPYRFVGHYGTKEDADSCAVSSRIDCIQIKHVIEVEE